MKKKNVDIQIFSKMVNSSFYGSLYSKVQEMAKEHKKRPKREQAKLEANILLTNMPISSSFKM